LALICASSASSRRNVDDACAGFAQRRQGGIERTRHRGLDTLTHHGLRHRHAQPVEREGGKVDRRFARKHGIEHGAASDRRRQRADRVERGRERKGALGRNAVRSRLESDDAA